MNEISDQIFSDTLKFKLGASYDRALAIFQNYNKQKRENEFGECIINLLLNAINKMRVNEVLDILEEQYHKYFYGSGRISDYAFQDTYEMFTRLGEILKLL